MMSGSERCGLCGGRRDAGALSPDGQAVIDRFGRPFHGLTREEPLCRWCVDEVELAGAERAYWAVAEAYSGLDATAVR